MNQYCLPRITFGPVVEDKRTEDDFDVVEGDLLIVYEFPCKPPFLGWEAATASHPLVNKTGNVPVWPVDTTRPSHHSSSASMPSKHSIISPAIFYDFFN